MAILVTLLGVLSLLWAGARFAGLYRTWLEWLFVVIAIAFATLVAAPGFPLREDRMLVWFAAFAMSHWALWSGAHVIRTLQKPQCTYAPSSWEPQRESAAI